MEFIIVGLLIVGVLIYLFPERRSIWFGAVSFGWFLSLYSLSFISIARYFQIEPGSLGDFIFTGLFFFAVHRNLIFAVLGDVVFTLFRSALDSARRLQIYEFISIRVRNSSCHLFILQPELTSNGIKRLACRTCAYIRCDRGILCGRISDVFPNDFFQ